MTGALIITAGRTSGGDSFQPEREVGTIPAIRRSALVFQRAGIRRVVAVCAGEKTERLAARQNLEFLQMGQDAEMLDHVKLGLRYLQDKCDQVLITHVNVPLFTADTVRALLQASGDVRVPTYGGRGGHPLLLRSSVFHQVLSYDGPDGLRGATRSLPRTPVPVEDPGVVTDVRREAVDQRLLEDHDLSALHPSFDFRIMREKVFYDAASHQLLRLTEETGSLMEACQRMGISYSKGRSIIAQLENQLGETVLQSRQGGRCGGGSQVTAAGRELMARYDGFCREARAYLTELFHDYFPD